MERTVGRRASGELAMEDSRDTIRDPVTEGPCQPLALGVYWQERAPVVRGLEGQRMQDVG